METGIIRPILRKFGLGFFLFNEDRFFNTLFVNVLGYEKTGATRRPGARNSSSANSAWDEVPPQLVFGVLRLLPPYAQKQI